MFLVRFILVVAFIFSSSLGKADKHCRTVAFPKNSKEKIFSTCEKIYKENKENDSNFKRKIKPKGTEVLVPNIAPGNFTHRVSHTLTVCCHFAQTSVKPYYDSNGKRGPPDSMVA